MSDSVDKGPVDDFVHRRFGREACPGDIASHVLVPASKEEARELTASWTHVNQVADHYGFLVLTGQYRGQTLSVCSLGESSASAAVAIEELADLGVHTFLGVGLADPFDHDDDGTLVIARGSVRLDGASPGYVQIGFPAAPSFDVVLAALQTAEDQDTCVDLRLVADLEGLGGVFARELGEAPPETERARAHLTNLGIVNSCASSATLFVQAAIFGARAGVVMANRSRSNDVTAERKQAMHTLALDTILRIAEWDNTGPTDFLRPYRSPNLATTVVDG